MTIKELKEKYDHINFIELDELPEYESLFRLKNIEDILSISNIVFFYNDDFDDEYNDEDEYFRDILDRFIKMEMIPYSLHLKFIVKARSLFSKNELPMFSKKSNIKNSSDIYLFEPKNDCYWKEKTETEEDFVFTEEHKKILKEILKNVEEEDIQKSKEINTFIEGFKNKYKSCTTKVSKENLIQEIQVNLKNKYNLDGRSDTIASKTGLRMILES